MLIPINSMNYGMIREITVVCLCNLGKTAEEADFHQRGMPESNALLVKTFVGAMNV